MALLSPADRRYTISTQDSGNYKELGEVSKSSLGAWSIQFAPEEDWIGEITVMARSRGANTNTDTVGFAPIAYIRQQLNLAAADYELVADVINGHATILVPASGLTIAIGVLCTRGTCVMYSQPLEGAAITAFRTGGVLEGV